MTRHGQLVAPTEGEPVVGTDHGLRKVLDVIHRGMGALRKLLPFLGGTDRRNHGDVGAGHEGLPPEAGDHDALDSVAFGDGSKVTIELCIDVEIESVQHLRPPDGEDGDPFFVPAQHARNLPGLSGFRLTHDAFRNREMLLHVPIASYKLQRLRHAQLVHELKRWPHHQANLNRHLEIGDVGDAAVEHFPHQAEESSL